MIVLRAACSCSTLACSSKVWPDLSVISVGFSTGQSAFIIYVFAFSARCKVFSSADLSGSNAHARRFIVTFRRRLHTRHSFAQFKNGMKNALGLAWISSAFWLRAVKKLSSSTATLICGKQEWIAWQISLQALSYNVRSWQRRNFNFLRQFSNTEALPFSILLPSNRLHSTLSPAAVSSTL